MSYRWQDRFGNISMDKVNFISKVLHNKDIEHAFDELVEKGYWSDSTIINDTERELALHKEFIHYYNFIMELTDKEFDDIRFNGSKSLLVHRIKLQLDRELRRVEKHEYEREEE